MSQPRGWSAELNRARNEDLDWMATTGETTEGAAKRLAITLDALEKWCARNNRPVWHRLLANTHRTEVA